MIFAFVVSSVELDKRTYASDSYARLVWFAMETKGEPTTRCTTERPSGTIFFIDLAVLEVHAFCMCSQREISDWFIGSARTVGAGRLSCDWLE
ncbi:hypothetical protein NPIL_452551, partial [Nephila pilipes]